VVPGLIDRTRRLLAAGAVALAAAVGSTAPAPAGAAEPERARAHIGYGPEHPLAQNGWRAFAERLEQSADAPKLDLFLNGPSPEDSAAIEYLGRGDYSFGAIALPAFPKDFPYAALLSEAGLTGGDDELAATAAATELLTLGCPVCQSAFARKHLVFLGAYSAARYVMISRAPATTVEALRGLSVLTPGSAWDRLIAGLGGAPAELGGSAGELFASGAIDAVIATPMRLSDAEVWAPARNVLAAPLGAYRGGGAFLASGPFWASLTPNARRAALSAAADGLVGVVWGYQNIADAALKDAAARGASIAAATPELAEAIRAIVQEDHRRIAATAEERFGIPDANAFLDAFLLLYDKFAVLLVDAEDAAAAAAVLRQEIFDRIDVETYGLEEDG